MKFPVMDYSWCQSSIGHRIYEISSSGLFMVFSPVLDIWFMKFPVVDYSWCQSSIGHGMYEFSSTGLFICTGPVMDIKYYRYFSLGICIK